MKALQPRANGRPCERLRGKMRTNVSGTKQHSHYSRIAWAAPYFPRQTHPPFPPQRPWRRRPLDRCCFVWVPRPPGWSSYACGHWRAPLARCRCVFSSPSRRFSCRPARAPRTGTSRRRAGCSFPSSPLETVKGTVS